MANLIRRGSGNEIAQAGAAWDPFRVMRDLLRWDPFREVEAALSAGGAGGYDVSGYARGFAPTFEVSETKDAYLFRADLPGVKEQDLEISLTGNRLSIAGHREQERSETSDTLYASERSYGSFSRSFTLPDGIDGENVSADLKNGVLTLSVPKKPEVQPRKVAINAGNGADKPKA
ncbi:MAG TPA: HSP20 family small heat-shock protein [Polyangia bacterium]|nr:HSP20 family small heat-shock protein [Polyangia bacterium]